LFGSVTTGKFTLTETPTLTKNFAGVGSRDIEGYNVQNKETGNWEPRKEYVGKIKEEKAKQAIREVYERTLGASSVEDITTESEFSKLTKNQQIRLKNLGVSEEEFNSLIFEEQKQLIECYG